jgi:hypothetical protein
MRPAHLIVPIAVLLAAPAGASVNITGSLSRVGIVMDCGNVGGCECSARSFTAPVRSATVEVRDALGVTSLGTAPVGSNSTFSVTATGLTAPIGFRLVVHAQGDAARVLDDATGDVVSVTFSYAYSEETTDLGAVTIDETVDERAPLVRGALNALDNAMTARKYAADRGLPEPPTIAIKMGATASEYGDPPGAQPVADRATRVGGGMA